MQKTYYINYLFYLLKKFVLVGQWLHCNDIPLKDIIQNNNILFKISIIHIMEYNSRDNIFDFQICYIPSRAS